MSRVSRPARRLARRLVRRAGYDVIRSASRVSVANGFPPDFDQATIDLCTRVAPYTLTGPERIAALREAVRYVVANGLPGAIAECGVWRGGSMMAAALTLCELGCTDRDLYLYDTFGWVPRPDERDVDIKGRSALEMWESNARAGRVTANPAYSYLPLDKVRELLHETGYPPERLHFVVGLVEETIPDQAPPQIALLRLDTDHYRSTAHELRHLYPRVTERGIVIIDDYGEFRGARDAVDEYFAQRREVPLLQRIDFSARQIVVAHGSGARWTGAYSRGGQVHGA